MRRNLWENADCVDKERNGLLALISIPPKVTLNPLLRWVACFGSIIASASCWT